MLDTAQACSSSYIYYGTYTTHIYKHSHSTAHDKQLSIIIFRDGGIKADRIGASCGNTPIGLSLLT